MSNVSIETYTVYKNPKDYPGKFVARKFLVTAKGATPTAEVMVEDSFEALRKRKPWDLITMGRIPGDDPCIVEVWI